MDDWVEIFRGKNGDWYWRRKAGNGRSRSIGGEGYKNAGDCEREAAALNPDVELRYIDDQDEH